jgi:SAM-dependent methyltransferase
MTVQMSPASVAVPGGAAVSSAAAVPGDDEYKLHIGPTDFYDVQSAIQFNLLTALGLRDKHYLLDIGCGSLRAGRLLIPYLQPGHYFGIEPLPWLIQEGVDKEIGEGQVRLKRPTFSHDENFSLGVFNQQFDFMIAQSIFSHTSQAQIKRCVAEAKKALKPDGVFAATFFEGPVNYEGERWVAKADYTMAHMRRMIEEQGMACTPIDWSHPDPQQWILIHHPGTVVALAQPVDAQRFQALEERLALVQQQFLAIKNHPYVRFGLGIKFFLVWVGFERRRIARWLRNLTGSKS